MRSFLIRWGITALSLFVVVGIFDRISADSTGTVLIAALLLGIVNAFVRPIVLIITLPFNILTLGLLTFVINGLMLKLVAWLLDGFVVEGFWPAVFGALVLGLISMALNALIGGGGYQRMMR